MAEKKKATTKKKAAAKPVAKKDVSKVEAVETEKEVTPKVAVKETKAKKAIMFFPSEALNSGAKAKLRAWTEGTCIHLLDGVILFSTLKNIDTEWKRPFHALLSEDWEIVKK